MAGLLGNLRVRLTAETEDFRRGMDDARQRLGSFTKDLNKFRNNTLANVASFGALAAVLRSSLNVANEYDNAQRQLSATSKLTGVNMAFLEQTSKNAQAQFKLSAVSANAFTIEMAKLAGKAGDMGKASAGLGAFLDIGAARGLSAAQTLKAVQQSILGIDEGTDKLFNANPSVLYQQFADSIHTAVGKLTDQQKAQAILNRAMQDGAKVRGEYGRWLETSAGQQFLLSQSMDQTQAVLGKALQPALVAVLPVISKMAEGVQMAVHGWQMLGATFTLVPALFSAAKKAISGHLDEARKDMADAMTGWRESIGEIEASSNPSISISTDIKPPTTSPKKVVAKWIDDLKSEWENLRNDVALEGISVGGTDAQRSQLEEAHALKLLDIEEEHIRARHKLKELTDAEMAGELKQVATRREIARARRAEMDMVHTANTSILADLQQQDTLWSNAVELQQMLGQFALERLGSEGSIENRLTLQLDIAEQTYQLKRAALIDDVRLTDTQLAAELLKLDLAKERERLQLRMSAQAQKDQATAARKAGLKSDLTNLGANLIGDVITGHGISGSEVGASLGAIAGGFVPIPGASIVLSKVGDMLGGLFGGKKDEPQAQPVIKGLDAIERAQRETITTIQAQTEALLNPESRLMNLPADFNIPDYRPATGTIEQHNEINLTFNVPTGEPRALQVAVEMAVGNVLAEQRRNQGW